MCLKTASVRARRACVRHSLVLLLALPICGCNWFEGLGLILPEPKKTVPAEFAHLKGSATVVVWVRPETMFDYPNVRIEVAGHVVDQLRAHVSRHLTFADILDVEDHLERIGPRGVDPVRIGREFGTTFVIYFELLEFSMRDVNAPSLLQGHIRSSVVVYDLSKQDLPAEVYELTPVETRVPDRPTRFTQNNAAIVLKATYETFAGTVAKKFYDHREVVE